jgi:hypothetical protein
VAHFGYDADLVSINDIIRQQALDGAFEAGDQLTVEFLANFRAYPIVSPVASARVEEPIVKVRADRKLKTGTRRTIVASYDIEAYLHIAIDKRLSERSV